MSILHKCITILFTFMLSVSGAPLIAQQQDNAGAAQNVAGQPEQADDTAGTGDSSGSDTSENEISGNATSDSDTSESAGSVAQQPDMPDIDNQPIQRAEGQTAGRFIPSEQISQDLGVSFPVDI